MHEGGIRVPMLARWPGHIKPNSVTPFVAGFQDLMPTLSRAVAPRKALPERLDGISLLSVLRGQEVNLIRSTPLYWEYQNRRALRRGEWKIYQSGPRQPWHLYNLKEDTSESNDVAKEHPELLRGLIAEANSTRSPSELYPLKGVDVPVEAREAEGKVR